jgi:hypothetical protein
MSLDLPHYCKNCSTAYRMEGTWCLGCEWCYSCGCDPAMAMDRCAVCGHPTCPESIDVDLHECPHCLDNRRLHAKALADCELEHRLSPEAEEWDG